MGSWIDKFLIEMDKRAGGTFNHNDFEALRKRIKNFSRDEVFQSYEKWICEEPNITRNNVINTFLKYLPRKIKQFELETQRNEKELLENPEVRLSFRILSEVMRLKIPACMKQEYLKPANPYRKPSKDTILMCFKRAKSHETLITITECKETIKEAISAIKTAKTEEELKDILETV